MESFIYIYSKMAFSIHLPARTQLNHMLQVFHAVVFIGQSVHRSTCCLTDGNMFYDITDYPGDDNPNDYILDISGTF